MPAISRRLIALAVGGAAALAVPALAPPALAAGSVPPSVITSGDWAGYAADTGTYTSVATTWTEPTLTCTASTTYSSVWDGLDGVDNSALEQTGTEAECVSGKPEYGAWWEVLPAAESAYSGVTVKPGDHMTASVAYNGGGTFTMKLTDGTEGWTKSTTHAGSSGFQNSSAEIIVEPAETVGGTGAVGSGTVTFTGSTVDGASLAAADPEEIVAPNTSVSPVIGGGFTVAWGPGVGNPITPIVPGRR